MTNWLITGGCGFIGTRLISRLVSDSNNQVCVLDNLSCGSREDLGLVTDFDELKPSQVLSVFTEAGSKKCALVEGDILDEKLANGIAARADVIVHLAANTGVGPSVENPRKDCLTNVIGTLNYLEAARQRTSCKFIFASSGAPLGEIAEPPIHEKLPSNPVSPYGASKLAGEGYCSAYFNTYGVSTVALRFGNVYGPGSVHKDSVVAKFIKSALNGETLEIYGDGKQTRDFIYIDDLVNAIICAAESENVGGEKFQIATNRESTVAELLEVLCNILHENSITDVDVVYGQARVGDVKRNFSDISKAKRMLGWSPEFDLKTGLEHTVDYFMKIAEQNNE